MVKSTRVEVRRLSACQLLAGRMLIASGAANAATAAGIVASRRWSGVVIVGQGGFSATRKLTSGYRGSVVIGFDSDACRVHRATPTAPMTPTSTCGGPSARLTDVVVEQLTSGADFVLTPTGQIRDLQTVRAAVEVSNGVASPQLVLSLPVTPQLLTAPHLTGLMAAVSDSLHPVALSLVGQFDPFARANVAQGLRVLSSTGKVFLHRSDHATAEVLAAGGLGGSIGYTAALRHNVTGRRPAKTRKAPPDRSPIVLLPGIDSYRHVGVFTRWFLNADPPVCQVPGCCGLDLRRVTHHATAHEHNLRALIPFLEDVVVCPPQDRRELLHNYRLRIEVAYQQLRAATLVRDIRMDDSQRTWLTLGP